MYFIKMDIIAIRKEPNYILKNCHKPYSCNLWLWKIQLLHWVN